MLATATPSPSPIRMRTRTLGATSGLTHLPGKTTENAIYENMCREEAAKNNLPIYVELRRGGDLIRSDPIRFVSYRTVSILLQSSGAPANKLTHSLTPGLSDWQITKFICFLIQNIYCQTAHKSRGVAPKRAPKCLVCLGLSAVSSSVWVLVSVRKGSPEDEALLRSNCLKNGRRTLKFTKCIYYGTKTTAANQKVMPT